MVSIVDPQAGKVSGQITFAQVELITAGLQGTNLVL
jgi:hypothetical protein